MLCNLPAVLGDYEVRVSDTAQASLLDQPLHQSAQLIECAGGGQRLPPFDIFSQQFFGMSYTRALISYDNPGNNFDTVVTAVADAKLQRRYGDNPLEIRAIGCTRESEAQRRGKWSLLTNSKDRSVMSRNSKKRKRSQTPTTRTLKSFGRSRSAWTGSPQQLRPSARPSRRTN